MATDPNRSDVEEWLAHAGKLTIGQLLPDRPWVSARLPTLRVRERILADLLAERGLALLPLNYRDSVVIPSAAADPDAHTILGDPNGQLDASTVCAFLDHLIDRYDAILCPHLQIWVSQLRSAHAQREARVVASSAEDLYLAQLPEPSTSQLRSLAEQIEAGHASVNQSVRRTLEAARAVGLLLIEAKALCGHGNFLRWLAQSVTFTARTAQNYMLIATRWHEIPNTQQDSHLTIHEVLEFLTFTRLPGDTPPRNVEQQLAAIVEEGGEEARQQAEVLRSRLQFLGEVSEEETARQERLWTEAQQARAARQTTTATNQVPHGNQPAPLAQALATVRTLQADVERHAHRLLDLEITPEDLESLQGVLGDGPSREPLEMLLANLVARDEE